MKAEPIRPFLGSLTNFATGPEWLAWIEHHSKTDARHGRTSVRDVPHGVATNGHGIGCKTVHPTDKAYFMKPAAVLKATGAKIGSKT